MNLDGIGNIYNDAFVLLIGIIILHLTCIKTLNEKSTTKTTTTTTKQQQLQKKQKQQQQTSSIRV